MKHPNFKTVNDIVIKAFSLKEDTASHDEIKSRLLSAGKVTGTNMCVMVCAMIIASVGLNSGSITMIIGAMLIEPLMGSILDVAYGVVSVDYRMTRDHMLGFLIQIGISVLAATLLFLISPIKVPSNELLSISDPSPFDVTVALVGGCAGVIGQTRKEKFNTIIPGVAIATSLMPPLCAIGYGLANGQWRIMGGAAYMFIVNAYFIFLGAGLVLSLFHIPRQHEMTDEEWKKLKRDMDRNTIVMLMPFIIALGKSLIEKII